MPEFTQFLETGISIIARTTEQAPLPFGSRAYLEIRRNVNDIFEILPGRQPFESIDLLPNNRTSVERRTQPAPPAVEIACPLTAQKMHIQLRVRYRDHVTGDPYGMGLSWLAAQHLFLTVASG